MSEKKKTMDLQELPALGVEKRIDEAPSTGAQAVPILMERL
ncbi:MAG: hypothetical protein ACKVK6_02800 [bacterium]|jgi:hypothetical protein